jgi:hypothetical protein
MKKKTPVKKYGKSEEIKLPKKPDGTISFDGLMNKLMQGKSKGK